jgi:hypothetical protein
MPTIIVVALIMAVLALPGTASAEPSARMIIENKAQTDDIHLHGLAAGLSVANAQLVVQNQRPIYCAPRDKALSNDELRSMMRDLLKENPKMAELPAAAILVSAMIVYLPCPKQQ